MATDLDAILAALERIERKLDRVLAPPRPRLRAEDAERWAALRDVIARRVATRPTNKEFTTRELYVFADDDAELRAALAGMTKEEAGTLLLRVAKAGAGVEQIGKDGGGRSLWSLCAPL